MFIVSSINMENMEGLASLTDPSKVDYCNQHGYKFIPKKSDWISSAIGFDKIFHTLKLFYKYPECEWLLFVECDALITNQSIKIEDKIDNNYHFICGYAHNGINSGTFLARNTEQGRDLLHMIIKHEPRYKNHYWAEQQVLIDAWPHINNIAKLVPMRYMNSLQMELYNASDSKYHVPYHTVDGFGQSMQWQPGDWIVHWPGTSEDVRIRQAKMMVERCNEIQNSTSRF